MQLTVVHVQLQIRALRSSSPIVAANPAASCFIAYVCARTVIYLADLFAQSNIIFWLTTVVAKQAGQTLKQDRFVRRR
jgi:hypothetical protein